MCRFWLWSPFRRGFFQCQKLSGHVDEHRNGHTWVVVGAENDPDVGEWR